MFVVVLQRHCPLMSPRNKGLRLSLFSSSNPDLGQRAGRSIECLYLWRYNCSMCVISVGLPWSSAGFLHSLLNLFRRCSSHLSVHSMCSCPAPASLWMHDTKNIQALSTSTPVRPDTLHWFSSVPAVLFTFPPPLIYWGGKTNRWKAWRPELFKGLCIFCWRESKHTGSLPRNVKQ